MIPKTHDPLAYATVFSIPQYFRSRFRNTIPDMTEKFSRLEMHLLHLISVVLLFPLQISSLSALSKHSFLTATAIVSDPNGDARIQCWEFAAPFVAYPTVGMALQLANTSNLTYVVLPPRSKEGLHKPPHVMYVT